MYGCKILQLPTVKVGGGQSVEPMKQILLSISSMAGVGSAAEIIFYHAGGRSIDLYFFAYGSNAEAVSDVVTKSLRNEFYTVEPMDNEDCANVKKVMGTAAQCGVTAITKAETLVTSPYVYEGYYYYCDVLLCNGFDNFNTIFNALLDGTPSFVAFQLKPTTLMPQEQYVLQNLTVNLQHKVNPPPPMAQHGMMTTMSEPYAKEAFNTYSYYTSNAVQPVYIFNIIAASGDGQSAAIAAAVMSCIQSKTENKARLQAYDISKAGRTVLETLNPDAVGHYIYQNCRNPRIWRSGFTAPTALARLSTLVTVDEALTFFRVPYDDGRIRGIFSSTYTPSNETVKDSVIDESNIVFGRSASDMSLQIGAGLRDFTRHALITGMPGFGKTTFSENILLQCYKKGIPFLCIEPTKKEYRGMLDAIPDLQVFTPGNSNGVPFILNPFLPPEGVSVKGYQSSLFSAFQASMEMQTPLDGAIKQAIARSYLKYGWRDNSKLGDPGTEPFGFSEFLAVFRNSVNKLEYEKELKGTLISALELRLTPFIEQCGEMFNNIHAIPTEDLLSKPTVIELDAIDNREQKALIIALILTRVGAFIRNEREITDDLKHVILMDEAHVLLESGANYGKDSSPRTQQYAAELVSSFISTIRSHGTSVIIADQRPSAVGEAILANTDLKISFRLSSKNERNLIADCGGMTEADVEELTNLDKGEALVYYSGLKKAQKVITPDIREENGIRINVTDDEVAERGSYWENHKELTKPSALCRYCRFESCDCVVREDAIYYGNRIWNHNSKRINSSNDLFEVCSRITESVPHEVDTYPAKKRDCLFVCIYIYLLDTAARKLGIRLNKEQIDKVFEQLNKK